MFKSFIDGFLLGAGAAMPIGPINILIINEALTSYRNAVLIGTGAMSADTTYLLSILLGIMDPLKSNNKPLSLVGAIGSMFLLYLSYKIFKSRNTIHNENPNSQTPTGIIKSYTKGYSLTLLNPYTIGFWLSVAAYVTTKNLNVIYAVAGLLTSITMWITLMPFAVHKTKSILPSRSLKLINVISSLVLLFFGISMLIASISLWGTKG